MGVCVCVGESEDISIHKYLPCVELLVKSDQDAHEGHSYSAC